MWYSIIAGLGIGLLGSFHCLGMCGPIALSLPIYGKSFPEKLLLIILYNLGRAFTYALLGGILGFIGNQFFLFGYQQIFSVTIGSLLLFFLFGSKYLSARIPFIGHLLGSIKSFLAKTLHSAYSLLSYFLVGAANGLLPCGLVYLAAGAAMATGSIANGAGLMLMFGFGTFPMMISVMIFGKFLPVSWRANAQKLLPIFVSITAVVIILRGLNLGIPMLSPKYSNTSQIQTVECHK